MSASPPRLPACLTSPRSGVADDRPSHASEIGISADRRFLYAANRGHDSIAVFALQEDSTLSLVEIVPSGGRLPWCFSFVGVPGEPDALHELMLVQNEFSGAGEEPEKPGSVCVFRRDLASGRLAATGQSVVIEKPSGWPTVPGPAAGLPCRDAGSKRLALLILACAWQCLWMCSPSRQRRHPQTRRATGEKRLGCFAVHPSPRGTFHTATTSR